MKKIIIYLVFAIIFLTPSSALCASEIEPPEFIILSLEIGNIIKISTSSWKINTIYKGNWVEGFTGIEYFDCCNLLAFKTWDRKQAGRGKLGFISLNNNQASWYDHKIAGAKKSLRNVTVFKDKPESLLITTNDKTWYEIDLDNPKEIEEWNSQNLRVKLNIKNMEFERIDKYDYKKIRTFGDARDEPHLFERNKKFVEAYKYFESNTYENVPKKGTLIYYENKIALIEDDFRIYIYKINSFEKKPLLLKSSPNLSAHISKDDFGVTSICLIP